MSITDAPIAAAGWPELMAEKVTAFIASARVAAADGITWAEFGELAVALLRLSIDWVDVARLPGPEKKAAVLAAVAVLFDQVADKAVPAYAFPVWLLVKPAVRSLLLALASGAVETLLPLVRAS
jgi:hypothetical protein